MRFYLQITQIVLAVLLITTILLQSRGAGLGGVFGGGSNVYQTKRGMEKILFISTVIIAALFIGVALINFLI